MVITLATEAEIRAMYINARKAVPQIVTPIEMGHPQLWTPIQTANLSAHSVVTKNIHTRRIEAMDIIFHCMRY